MYQVIRLYCEIGAFSCNAEITDRSAPTHAAGIVQRRWTHTGRVWGVVVWTLRESVGARRFVKRPLIRIPFIGLEPPHNDRAFRPVEITGEIGVSLDHPKVRHQLLKAPPVVAPR